MLLYHLILRDQRAGQICSCWILYVIPWYHIISYFNISRTKMLEVCRISKWRNFCSNNINFVTWSISVHTDTIIYYAYYNNYYYIIIILPTNLNRSLLSCIMIVVAIDPNNYNMFESSFQLLCMTVSTNLGIWKNWATQYSLINLLEWIECYKI